ncbi:MULTISPECIES: hypothetical protein [unclassified Knoellia]|uniref:hypothetical protein n=1 Tax=Knoellia altitudinis TaxID=3404795 RepID=UPI00360F94C7
MTGPILQPIEGNADSVRSLAASLTSGAAKLSAINAVLVTLKAGSSWASPAGELFESSVRESPPLLDALIDRYAGAAAALLGFADELGESQAAAQRAIEWKKAEESVDQALQEQIAGRMNAGEPIIDLLSLQNQVLANMNQAQQRHALAWERFDSADRRLARTLRMLAEDILGDSWHYTAVTKVQGFSQAVGSLPVWAKKAPVVGQATMVSDAVSTASQVALRVFYDEGSWKEIGINTAASVTLIGGSGLKSGALAGASPVSRLADGRRAYTGEQIGTGERFAIGTREQLQRKVARVSGSQPVPTSRMVVPLDTLPPVPGLKGLPLQQKAQALGRHSAAMATRKADETFFDSWKAATAGGPDAQRMFVAGTTLEKVIPKVEARAVDAVDGNSEEKASRPTYP